MNVAAVVFKEKKIPGLLFFLNPGLFVQLR